MAKTFDFNKLKEKTMTVVLSDEAKTTLIVKTPTKALKEYLDDLQKEINTSNDEEELEDALYNATAKIMSNNKDNIEVTPEKLKELFKDVTFILDFINAYMEFIDEYTNASKK